MANPKRIACLFRLTSQERSEEEIEKKLQKLAESCMRFTPQVAIRPKEAIFLEVGKSLHLFSEESLKARIYAIAGRLGIPISISLAPSIYFSLVKIYYPEFELTEYKGDLSCLPLEALVFFLNPFENDSLQKKETLSFIDTLKALGIKNIQQFIKIPSAALGPRFGKLAILLHSACQNKFEPAWKGFFPSPLIEESLELSDPESENSEVTLEPLLFILKGLIDRAMVRLRGIGKRASVIQIELQLSPWSTLKTHKKAWTMDLPVPQGSSHGLLPILRDRISFEFQKEPLSTPARSVRFKILETVPGHGAQRDFFHSKELTKENKDQLLGRLLQQLGKDFVFYAHPIENYCPEKSWVRTLQPELSPLPKIGFKRPSRILKNPEPVTIFTQPGSSTHFLTLSNGKSWEIFRWDGPERISTAWWDTSSSKPIERDYYCIVSKTLEKFWIFFDSTLPSPQAFLHGYFD